MSKQDELDFAAFAAANDNPDAQEIPMVSSIENPQGTPHVKKGITMPVATPMPAPKIPGAKKLQVSSATSDENTNKLREEAQAKAAYNKNVSVAEEHALHLEKVKLEIQNTGMGFVPIFVELLPTRGKFYPADTKIFIKAASMNEIKHWSASDESDLSAMDDALNDIIEKCCVIKFGLDDDRIANWKDLKEIDRFYVVLAIHDFTFPPGKNDLIIDINETKSVHVLKDNIDFVKFSDKIMKYYNDLKRCFSFPVKANCVPGHILDIYLPSVGVSKWLKDYILTRSQRREGFDRDFVAYAPILLEDFRGLNNDTYTGLIEYTLGFTPYEWALLSKVKSIIETSITPVLKYMDDAGMEQETSLNFRGGIKAIFEQSLDIDL